MEDGWDVAMKYHGLKTLSILPTEEKKRMRRIATLAVLDQARKVMAHFHRRYDEIHDTIDHTYGAGELELDHTLESHIDHVRSQPTAEDIWVNYRRIRDTHVVLMLDTSLSMSGAKHTLLAVGVATLLYQLGPEQVELVTFNSVAHRLRSPDRSIFGIVEALLDEPDQGFTNMEAAFKSGMRRGKPKSRYVMITDGKPTAGADPIAIARRMRPLDVISIGDESTEISKKLALAGSGKHKEVADQHDLPKALYSLSLTWK